MKITFLIEICAHEFIYLFTKLKALEKFSIINPCSKGGAILTSKNKVGGVNE
jgi:predicted transcriptional regulator